MTNLPIYFDYNATAPLRDTARGAMMAALENPGNASSIHSFGRSARKMIEDAREQVAKLVGAQPKQVVFNSGATEGNNTILRGFSQEPGGRVLVSAIEHSSILETVPHAQRIPVTPDGVVDLDTLHALIKGGPSPTLISVMLVNNETGVIQPVAEIAQIAREYGAITHCDAVQGAGRIPVDMNALNVDFLTLSSHKIGGPQGAGAIIMSDGTMACLPVPVMITGGGQEQRRRAGTENVAAIAGFGAAAQTAHKTLNDFAALKNKRDRLEQILCASSNRVRIFGTNVARVANTICLTIPGISAETLLMNLDLAGIAVSSGSACSSGTVKPSHVLLAMGAAHDAATSNLRFSIGWDTIDDEIDRFEKIWGDMAQRLRI